MTLGIPPNVVMALLLAPSSSTDCSPARLLITQIRPVLGHPPACISHVMLLVLNLPLIGMWVQLLKTGLQHPVRSSSCITIIAFYCSSNNVFDVYVMIRSAWIGYFHAQSSVRTRAAGAGICAGADALRTTCANPDLRKAISSLRAAPDLGGMVLRCVVLLSSAMPSLRKEAQLVALTRSVGCGGNDHEKRNRSTPSP